MTYSTRFLRQILKITFRNIKDDNYHRQAVTVPAKPPLHMKTALMGEAGDNVFNGPC